MFLCRHGMPPARLSQPLHRPRECFLLIPTVPLSPGVKCWWLLAKAVNVFLVFPLQFLFDLKYVTFQRALIWGWHPGEAAVWGPGPGGCDAPDRHLPAHPGKVDCQGRLLISAQGFMSTFLLRMRPCPCCPQRVTYLSGHKSLKDI